MDIETKKILASSLPFKYLDANELDRIITYGQLKSFPSQTNLIQQGKNKEGMYIIIFGSAIVFAKVVGEEVIELARLKAKNFIGEITLIEKGSSFVSVISDSDLKCLFISRTYFEMLAIIFPETHYKIIKAITEEVYERIKLIYLKILEAMKKSSMVANSFFSQIRKPLANYSITTFENEKLIFDELCETDFFKIFTYEECLELIQNSSLIKTPSQCTLIHQGQEKTPIYITLRGAVQVSIIDKDKVAKLAIIGPMELFCSISNIMGKPALLDYITCERALLLEINFDKFMKIQVHNKLLWYKLFGLICKLFVSMEKAADKLHIRINSEKYNQ